MNNLRYRAIVIGLSSGGMEALKFFVPALPVSFPLPIAIAQHIGEDSDGFLAGYLDNLSPLTVKEAEDKEPLLPGHIYFAPAGYHLLIERDHCFSLSADPRVHFSCPSIDVLFESAAEAFAENLIGAVLTGANSDGSEGLKAIRAQGGLALVQNPGSAESRAMPLAALNAVPDARIVELQELAPMLVRLGALCDGGAYEPVSL